ncbi:hypothetical protein D0469_05480 [Peribacillus saganii]|uniref:Uncharacterized protein n=1 Tax=Peribacillus saganii TaxID=2303992 RepID=A0A372LSY3_9BACI|nr:DUF6092 family protein [Peribacillus saganii]RFU70664.1 hypothetical protein D0469_05480 [Peribacillus saganii]
MTITGPLETEQQIKEHLRDYVAYALTSAKGLYREPQSYGAMRMFDAMERALRLLQEVGVKDEALEEALTTVRKQRWQAMTNPDAFGKAIDDSILNLVDITINQNID